MRIVEIPLAVPTRQAIADEFLHLARRGMDVQVFDPAANHRGSKPSIAGQLGFYGAVDARLLRHLGALMAAILIRHDEVEALRWFNLVRRLPHDELADAESVAPVQILDILPDAMGKVEPEDLRAPNGLRVPDSIQDRDEVCEYSALLLLPKLVLAAIAGLTEMSPWVDADMDLGSAVHTIRPDDDKLADGSGYGAGQLACHTDGYWSAQDNVPAWNVMLCATNPFDEPTTFIRVADVFRIPDERHADHADWAARFADLLLPGQSPRQFVTWVLEQALKPQFNFAMGQIGSGAARSVRGIPLLEEHRTMPGFLFRYKSTFTAVSGDAQPVIEFVNRMVTRLSCQGERQDIVLRPGSMVFALNGCCLGVNSPDGPAEAGAEYPVWGNGTIHGRDALKVVKGRVERTIVRCNLVPTADHLGAQTSDGNTNVATLLRSGYRANHLQR